MQDTHFFYPNDGWRGKNDIVLTNIKGDNVIILSKQYTVLANSINGDSNTLFTSMILPFFYLFLYLF